MRNHDASFSFVSYISFDTFTFDALQFEYTLHVILGPI